MRDENRIDPFLKELGDVWKKVPDWRFGQLMVNYFRALSIDPFFLEEKDFIKILKEISKSW